MEEESTKNTASGSFREFDPGSMPSKDRAPKSEVRKRSRHGYALFLASGLTLWMSYSMMAGGACPPGPDGTVRNVSFHGNATALASRIPFDGIHAEPRLNLGPAFAVLVLISLLIRCTWTDIEFGRIRNSDTYPAAVAVVFAQILTPLLYWGIDASFPADFETQITDAGFAPFSKFVGARDLGECLMGGLLCFAIMFFSFLTAGGGGGDVKLGTVIGLSLGPRVGAFSLVYSYLAAGAYLCGLFMYWRMRDRVRNLCGAGGLESVSNDAPAMVRQAGTTQLFGRWGMWLRMSPFFLIGTFAAMIEALAGGVR